MEDLQKLINEWKQEAAALMSKIQNNPVLDNYQFINGSAQRLRLCIAEVELLLPAQQPNSDQQPQLQQTDVVGQSEQLSCGCTPMQRTMITFTKDGDYCGGCGKLIPTT